MPIYVYETIPADDDESPRRFELKQSMFDEPLTQDPETGQLVRRVIMGATHYFARHRFAACCANSGCGCN